MSKEEIRRIIEDNTNLSEGVIPTKLSSNIIDKIMGVKTKPIDKVKLLTDIPNNENNNNENG